MDPEIKNILEAHTQKLEEIYISTEKTRKYFLWTLITSLVFFLLPLLGIALILPSVLSSLTSGLI